MEETKTVPDPVIGVGTKIIKSERVKTEERKFVDRRYTISEISKNHVLLTGPSGGKYKYDSLDVLNGARVIDEEGNERIIREVDINYRGHGSHRYIGYYDLCGTFPEAIKRFKEAQKEIKKDFPQMIGEPRISHDCWGGEDPILYIYIWRVQTYEELLEEEEQHKKHEKAERERYELLKAKFGDGNSET